MTKAWIMKKPFDLSYAITLVAIFSTGIASAGLLLFKPLIVGALIDDYHFSPAQSGFVAGIEMAGIGFSSFIVAAFGGAWNRRRVILIGATLGILGSLGPILSEAYMPILLCRLMAGIGCGLIAAVVLAVIGTTRDPDRTFGLYYMFSYASAALLMPLGVWTMIRFHVVGGYILMTLLLCIAYVTAHRIPATYSGLREDGGKHTLPPFPLMSGLLSLGLSLIFWIGFGGIWAFVERLGVTAGLEHAAIGGVLSLSQVAAFGGAMTASLLHLRFGRTPLLAASIGFAILGVVMVGWASSISVFTIGVLIFGFIWPLFLAYLGGTMALLDPAGRIIAMSVASQTVGMAIGPALAGVLAGMFGYVAIAIMAIVCFTLTLALVPPLMLKIRASDD